MEALINSLKQGDIFSAGKKLTEKDVIELQKNLLLNNYPQLPKMFIDFLKEFNGIKTSYTTILGINPDHKNLDLLSFNQEMNARNENLILGFDDFAYLVFDGKHNQYLLISRDNMDIIEDFLPEDFEFALNSIIHDDND